jgi:signal transduction histidine kinase
VLADRNMTSTILRNLLSNALQATPPGGQIVLAATAATAGYLSLEVRDTGAGMATAQLRHAQGLAAAGAPAPGRRGPTGLGLRLSRAFAQAQHGRLGLSSQPGQGTTAALSLPVAPAPMGVFLPAAASAAV